MPTRDIIVIGASAGGIEAIQELLQLLPGDLDASIFIVVHLAPHVPSCLARVLSRGTHLPIETPVDGQIFEKRHVYVAPANQHMLINEGTISLNSDPLENWARPSVDSLFRTAAGTYHQRVVGIILSGALHDGTAGLQTVKSHGGLAIVQKPEEAAFGGMPKSAIAGVDVDYVLSVPEIAKKIIELVDTGNVTDQEDFEGGRLARKRSKNRSRSS
ncbi:MAG: chemotaxis protein CheB [Candidatus Melainabacteria bacterium]|nr:chemotaxis protein CheB [Candidatus Melainabacteria bacterium]